MERKTLEAIEFDKIKSMVIDQTITEYGNRAAEALVPLCEFLHAKKLLSELSEAIVLFIKKGNVPIASVNDISDQIKRAELGGTLNAAELLDVAKILKISNALITYYN
ncbi:MAG: hypothetical protein GX800_00580, partial [Clostridiaceae bacterium]|nr:hypothetical protein [Clostridiaceae bacterium]